jgi:nitrite reductase/ring-hydroxylating ferredoxin subunit
MVVAARPERRCGLLELHCPHRGASLEYGQIDTKGIRCCYHGWLFAADGAILERPGEPAESTLKDRLCHGAYPVREHHDIVFAYSGGLDHWLVRIARGLLAGRFCHHRQLSRPSLCFRQGTDFPRSAGRMLPQPTPVATGTDTIFLSECFVYRGPDDPRLDNVHMQ